jgi:hypothetical protein
MKKKNQMKKPTELEVELHKLLSEAIDGLFDAGQDSMAKHILKEMRQVVKKSKQPYEMVQPNSDDTYDKYGVNTKNSFNTPPKQ